MLKQSITMLATALLIAACSAQPAATPTAPATQAAPTVIAAAPTAPTAPTEAATLAPTQPAPTSAPTQPAPTAAPTAPPTATLAANLYNNVQQGVAANGVPTLGRADAPLLFTDYSDFL